MQESNAGRGKCLCGEVSFVAQQVAQQVGACHCNTCVNWGGGPLLAVDCGADITFAGESSIQRYQSSAWAERGFCKNCGTHLFYHLKGADRYMVPAGLFDDKHNFALHQQIFIDKKPGFYAFANDTEKLTEAEVLARHQAPV